GTGCYEKRRADQHEGGGKSYGSPAVPRPTGSVTRQCGGARVGLARPHNLYGMGAYAPFASLHGRNAVYSRGGRPQSIWLCCCSYRCVEVDSRHFASVILS